MDKNILIIGRDTNLTDVLKKKGYKLTDCEVPGEGVIESKEQQFTQIFYFPSSDEDLLYRGIENIYSIRKNQPISCIKIVVPDEKISGLKYELEMDLTTLDADLVTGREMEEYIRTM